MNLDLAFDPTWALGLLMAQTRVAAFALTAPQIGTAVPAPGRLAFVLAMALALATPLPAASTAAPALIAAGVVNATVGATLGFLVGILFQLFAVAGSLIDISSGLSIAAVVDPTRNNEQGAVMSRLFSIAGLTLFHVGGGLALLVSVLAWSVESVPLDGRLRLDGTVAETVVELIDLLVVSGIELALPVVAALFLVEVVLGLASRFAPTANVFLLGMPAKVGLALVLGSASVVMFPTFLEGLLSTTRDTIVDVLNAMVATPP